MNNMETLETQAIFAKKLQLLIDENNLTQSELAEMLEVSESAVGKWLLKKAMPRMGVVEKLSSIFNCPKSYLLEEEETRRSYYLDPQAAKMAQELYDNPEMRILFDAARNVSAEDLKLAAEIISRMKKQEEPTNY